MSTQFAEEERYDDLESALEERLAELVRSSSLIVCLFDLARGHCIASSPGTHQLLGVSKNEEYHLLRTVRDRIALIREKGLTGLHFDAPVRLASGELAGAHFAIQLLPTSADLALALVQLNGSVARADSVKELVPVALRAEPVVFGTIDAAYRILRVSSDVSVLLGHEPSEVIGRPVVDFFVEDRVAAFVEATRWVSERRQTVTLDAAVRSKDGSARPIQFVVASAAQNGGREGFFFAIRPVPTEGNPLHFGRLQELEERMWRIAMEVQAAEVAPAFGPSPNSYAPSIVAKLTSRQLEIVTRLLEGERVPAIAAHLFLSPSTVRNHLSAVFAKFGVHSQHELFEALRRET